MFWYNNTSDDPWFDRTDKLQALIDSDEHYHLLDVRSNAEFAEGSIPTAVHVPYLEVAERVPTDDRSALIIVYCHSGGRSETAKDILVSHGFTNVHNFGGIIHWKGRMTGGPV